MNTPARTSLSHSRAVMAAAAFLLAAFVVLFGGMNGASAHDELTGTDPADGTTLDAAPAAVTFTFSAELLGDGGATEIAVSDPSGASVVDGGPTVDGAVVTQTLTPGLTAEGTYTVLWKVVSSDGHPISGELTFNVGEASAPVTPAPGDDSGMDVGNLVWIIVGLLIAAGGGALVYVLIRRARTGSQD